MQTDEAIVYMMANFKNDTLYTGVTSNLMQRIYQHRSGTFEGFTKDHSVKLLVWYEAHEYIEAAIAREKRIKKWNRQWKINLIKEANLNWRDLAVDLGFEMLPTRGR